MSQHLHFVTGRLAEHALRDVLSRLSNERDFQYSVGVMPISVAALMTPKWIARHLDPPEDTTTVIVPGYCQDSLRPIEEAAGLPVERGPRDLRQLPEFFGRPAALDSYGEYDVQIVAEINHAPRLEREQILREAERLVQAGADLVDVGCEPGEPWSGVGDCVKALRGRGYRVSVDSLHPQEIAAAVAAGAELVLSVLSCNREAAADWGCEVVVIPDEPRTLAGLDDTIEYLAAQNVPLRIDPILEPIGCGFAASLGRYLEVRRRFPDTEMLMGVGNLTELTDVDSAAINVLLLGFCQELGVRSVLTTQVINWARTSVRECALARQLVHYAVRHGVPPKNISDQLVALRDPHIAKYGLPAIQQLANQIKDNNYRILAEDGEIHLLSARQHLHARDPFALFAQLLQAEPKNLDLTHAFYLGFEMAKASSAITLGKQYEQDEALDWGFLTEPENHHRLK